MYGVESESAKNRPAEEGVIVGARYRGLYAERYLVTVKVKSQVSCGC